jgi:putative flavoprotein involved in K+ transport
LIAVKAPAASTISTQKPTIEDKVYPVVILGGGQCGLATAARLESLGVQTIVIERNARIGDNWRLRYEALNINTPKAFSERLIPIPMRAQTKFMEIDHLPFVPYPSSWPHFPPSGQVADFMEDYVYTLGLTIWTSTTLQGTTFDVQSSTWTVNVKYSDGSEGSIRARHFVLATGIGQLGLGSKPVIPAIPGIVRLA